jgi:hypothetical protein
MTESTGPQTPEEEAALCALEARHQRRHRWVPGLQFYLPRWKVNT